ncbi:class I SAM-dependent methyltransferase [Actinomyces sp. zg296]|uniref:class I SAM-dependent methyltransferase n=1 Tax=Actinomyces sp. zg296 TaxID=2609289 RepID=UPI001F19D577|nr:class I SAM-dependent methyltransferase [Actinomyces sp. zg296]
MSASAVHGQRQGPEASRMQGHWLLAKLGKRVLRPGGIELTRRLLKAVDIHPGQRIVELGPGVGRTAEILLRSSPASYRAVDPNPEGREQVAAVLAGHPRADYVVADAADTGLPTGEADLVVGEAMLTMQSEEGKRAIVAEAARLLAPGGRYAIHELALRADRGEEEREAARKRLSRIIKVGARPLAEEEWRALLTEAGLEVVWTGTAPMRLLEPRRLIADEGIVGALRFWRAVRRTPGALDRVKAMRETFRAQGELLSAVGIVARKPASA